MAKLITFFAAMAICIIAVAQPAFSEARVFIDEVQGIYGTRAAAGHPVRLILRVEYTPGDSGNIVGFSNGFRIWTGKNGAYTNNFTPIAYDTIPVSPPWMTRFDVAVNMAGFGVDGTGADTVGFFGVRAAGQGFEDGFDQQVWWIETTPTVIGDTLWIDSSVFNPPSGTWLWVRSDLASFSPNWGGPYFFEVVHPDSVYVCGDVDDNNVVNILDVTYLVNYLYKGGPRPLCPWE
jgi:hypothetical protein